MREKVHSVLGDDDAHGVGGRHSRGQHAEYVAVSANLLVAGARGSTAPILGAGTLATKLARKAPTKVLLVSEGGTAVFHKVVACVDFSSISGLAVEQATRVACRESGQIRLVASAAARSAGCSGTGLSSTQSMRTRFV